MNPFKTILLYIKNRRITPRIRGFLNGLINPHSSTKALIYHTLRFTSRYIKIGSDVIIYKNCRIQGISTYLGKSYKPLIVLQSKVTIQQNCHITCAKSIEIGENTAIASNVTITDIDHPYIDVKLPPEKQHIVVRCVNIGKDCKIYNNSVILPGVIIGNHCIIGANAVVTRDIPDYCVAVGIPARIIKRYDFSTNSWRKTHEDGTFI